MEQRFGERTIRRLHWGTPPRRWRLADDEVHCWAAWLDTSQDSIEQEVALLSLDERERAARFRAEKARHDFVTARIFLRKLLSTYLEIPPREIVFLYSLHGKPVVAPWMNKELQFNISHSHQLALAAVTLKHEVGIDVEHVTSIPESTAIARRMFPREAQGRVQNEAQVSQEFFFRSWTRSEAVLKCSGEGISDSAQTTLHLSKTLVCELEPATGYVGAVAVSNPASMQLKTWRWEE